MTMPLDSPARVRILCDASDPTGALWKAVQGTEFLQTVIRTAQRLEVVNDQMGCIAAALSGLGLDPAAEPIAIVRRLREDADLSRQRAAALREITEENTGLRQKLSGRPEKPRASKTEMCRFGFKANLRRPGQCASCGRMAAAHA